MQQNNKEYEDRGGGAGYYKQNHNHIHQQLIQLGEARNKMKSLPIF